MRAMILAGGMSTRLYPLTKQVPKPIVPVVGEPISGHVMRWLSSFGYDEVAINVFYLAELVQDTFGDGSRYGVKLHYLRERELTGSAGALKQMEGWFDGTFVVVGCDDLTDADLASLVHFHKARGALATIGLLEVDEVDQY
ncbi:MAG: nucleotidyltransferase family protein, partial [Candidatus Eremiobacteraeota bacterium]|nr:nucleotidyltransferase family protein [Candidatus Eremiobacteraeota bacterium]